MEEAKKQQFRQGLNTALALGVLTAIEFVVAFIPSLWPVLVALAFIKVWLVLQNFMHIGRVFSPEAEGGH